jgi:hypothetical protein
MIKKETIEKIKKYHKLRGALDERLKADILIEIYTKATNRDRILYNKEMNRYIEAVESGKIEPGQPYVLATLKS